MTTLLFDMDGLLLDTERVCQQAFMATTERYEVAQPGDSEFYLGLVGGGSAQTRALTSAYLPDHVEFDAFDADWRVDMKARLADHVPLRPHVREVLEAMAAKGFTMAVVTSTHKKNALHHLETANLLEFFAHVTGGDEVAANKPHPAPYLETANRLGVDPKDCYAFEDSDPGITAAMQAGCIATQIPDLRPAGKSLPNLGQRVADDLCMAMQQLGLL